MDITKALMTLGNQAVSKGANRAVQQATTSALTKVVGDAAQKALTKNLTGALGGVLAKGSGSTLDGILGKSSGLILPQAKVTPKSIAEYTGGQYNTVGDVMSDLDYSLSDIKADKALSKRNLDTLEKSTREIADINGSGLDSIGVSSKSKLPMLDRSQYYEDTLGKVGENGVRAADVPDYMQKHLTDPKNMQEKFVRSGNDEVLRELFNDDTSPISELYDRYDRLAQSDNANEIFTPDNIDQAIELANYDKKGAGDAITQDFADRTFGNKRDISISGGSSPAKNIKVGRAMADNGTEVVSEQNANLANKIADMKAELQTATGGSGMKGGGTPTATASPDYGGLGDSGFNVNLNADRTVNVVAGDGGVGATSQQKAQRALRDKALKENLNTNSRQYADLMGKSRSYGGHYATVADRIDAENITLANVAQKTESMLNHIENIKERAFDLADELGLTVDLNGIDNATGLRPFQKKQLSELGLNLNDIIGDKVVDAKQAEDIYRIMKSYAYDLQGSEKALEKQAGKSLDIAAKKVSERIDNVLDSMGVDFKKEFLDGAGIGGVGADGAYLRKIGESPEAFKFSDLRREESDWINIGKTSGNKLKEEKVPESIAEAVGQGFRKGSDRIKEKFYRKQAAGGSGGINFTSPTGNGNSILGNILGKAKNTGLVGAGLLGGLMLGGGNSGSAGGMVDTGYDNVPSEESEPEVDPYTTMTIGGYNYQQLEDGYSAALMAGDTEAAKLISNMIGMLTDKIDRYNKQKESSSSSSGIAGKQKAAMNVLSSLMSNYEAQGPIGGRLTQLLNSITGGGYNPGVSAYDSGAKGSLGTIIKALGDTGALSEGDQQRALMLLPQTTDSAESAKMKYQQLMQILRGAGAQ